MADLDQEIKTMVSRIIKVPEEKLKPDANIFTEYGVDSLLGVEILAGLDKKYGLNVPEEKVREIKTLNDIVRIASELMSRKA